MIDSTDIFCKNY